MNIDERIEQLEDAYAAAGGKDPHTALRKTHTTYSTGWSFSIGYGADRVTYNAATIHDVLLIAEDALLGKPA